MAELRGGVPSPCNQICVLDAEQVCMGCGRSRDEIGQWGEASIELQLQIVERAQRRLHKQQSQITQKKDTQ